jgi:hypothetical protein
MRIQITSKTLLQYLHNTFNKHGYRMQWEGRTGSFEPLLSFHVTTTNISYTMRTMVR